MQNPPGQAPAGPPPVKNEIDLTEWAELINNALADDRPCLVASAGPDGEPDIAFKGSVMVFDKEHLAWWERSLAEQIAQVEKNPKVVVLYRNPQKGIPHMRIYGEATLHKQGDPKREEIMGRVVERELNADPERKGFGVSVKVNRVRVGRNVVQQRA